MPGPDGLQSRIAHTFIVPYYRFYDVTEVWKYGPGRYDAKYLGTIGEPFNVEIRPNYERAQLIDTSLQFRICNFGECSSELNF